MRFESALSMNLLVHLQECVKTKRTYTDMLNTIQAEEIHRYVAPYLEHKQGLTLSTVRYLYERYSQFNFIYSLKGYKTTGNTAVEYNNKLYLFYCMHSSSDRINYAVYIKNINGYSTETYNWDHRKITYTYCDIDFINVSYLRVLGWDVITTFKHIKKLASISKSLLDPRLFDYQVKGVQMLASGFRLMADEQGCVASDSKVFIKEQGKPATRSVSISTLSRLYNVDKSIKIKTMCNGRFVYMPIKAVVNKGIQHTIKITLQDRSLVCTPDHLLYTKDGWIEAGKLSVGDQVYTNGKQVCPVCGTDKDLVTYKYSKFKGYCRKCMYSSRNGIKYNKITKTVDKDGYIWLKGKELRTSPLYNKAICGVLEHHYVWYKNTGHIVDVKTESIHHINGIKSDNRFENLQLLSISGHCRLHSDVKTKHLYQFNENLDYIYHNGTKVTLVPELQKVIFIDNHEDTEVWDIAIDDVDIHNFICNGIVVHNCGKTAQVLQYVELEGLRKILIVCPATLKLNWQREIAMWTHTSNDRVAVVYGTHPYDVKARFTIINYDLLPYWKDYLSKKKFELICCDECHYIQSATAQRTKAFVAIAKHADDKIFISGTPFTSKPLQMYTALHNIAPRIFRTQYDYGMRFCHPYYFGNQLKFNGASNTSLLHDILADGICIRRLKQDVLKDLPEKMRVTVPIGLTPDEVKKSPVASQIKTLEDRIAEASDSLSTLEFQRQIAYLRKRDMINNWIRDFLESGKKLVVFGVHRSTLDTIEAEFPDISVRIDGSTPNHIRDTNVQKFQNDLDIKLFIGNVQAAGTGITLTAASDAVMVEFPYSSAQLLQAEDRIHRIGAKNACMVYYMAVPGTIDERMIEIVNQKAKMHSNIFDATDDNMLEVLKKDGGNTYKPIF